MRTPTVILALALYVTCTMAQEKTPQPLQVVADGTEQFSTNFFKAVASANKDKNLISSPLSAHVVLSMAAYGAGGNTAVQMRQALHLPSDDVVAKQGFENLVDTLNKVEKVTLEVANKMYLAGNVELKPEFKLLTRDTFRSEASEIDTSKPAVSAKLINDWVDERTHHKINEIVKADEINGDTRMILLNAVYFKGKWASAFKKENTEEKDFHLDAKTKKKVPMMFASGSYVYGELPDLKAKFVELPYENKDLKMVIIVPDEIEGLNAIQDNLESFNHSRLADASSERDVLLHVPKFKIESSIDLQKPLESLGMTDMFASKANFSGISTENLKIAKVLQKAFIEVNEEGSEAAAATMVGIMPYSFVYKPQLKADRPFFFAIVDKRTKVTLFTGRVIQPKSN